MWEEIQDSSTSSQARDGTWWTVFDWTTFGLRLKQARTMWQSRRIYLGRQRIGILPEKDEDQEGKINHCWLFVFLEYRICPLLRLWEIQNESANSFYFITELTLKKGWKIALPNHMLGAWEEQLKIYSGLWYFKTFAKLGETVTNDFFLLDDRLLKSYL